MSAATTFLERRRSVRNRTLIGGKAIFNQRQSTLDCTVRNLSEDGALLVFSNSAVLPELFELYFPLKRESRMVRSRWRDAERIGVSFAAATRQDEAPIPLDLVRRLRQLKLENTALKARIVELTEGA
ncbi:MAG: PilZ domain-containing protein [Bosea sp.]|uniref:PilZ domain-containing protein n=1 Tax=Bosea sp. (in: a-proteobacteria) TaxID=1871050 RepID=UPI0023852D8E|nr:PilZ domain-containing protein [Bosea sp. (in: a-proteobacteria)]MCP4734904.1 PilZ domain-containing protein [Bosea sp. (in: a-proteobacteria)]